jgi:proline dehydrogenase
VKEVNKIDFSNTEIAFKNKSDQELKKAYQLFKMMNKSWFVNLGSKLGTLAVKWNLPFSKAIVKNTIFEQFCGGTTLLNSQPTIDKLAKYNVVSLLDYGAEGKITEEAYNRTMNENIKALEFASTNPSIPVVTTKITGLARFELLEKISAGESLSVEEEKEYSNVLKRIDAICASASKNNTSIFIDAEETWIQDSIDSITNLMMSRYNKDKVSVFNTFQMYRHDRLAFLKKSYEEANKQGYLLGAKLVRGAYMEKERARAAEMGYDSPINPSKQVTDEQFNQGIRFCVDHYETIALCNATHNLESSALLASLIQDKNLPKDHPHLNFCQLYGMSDNLTFNLAAEGFNVGKYVVYGQVEEVVPYLVRRAQENASVTGDMSRELELYSEEIKRRSI